MEKDSNLPGSEQARGLSNSKPLLSILWICSIFISGFIGFIYGRSNQNSQTGAEKNTLAVSINQITNTPTPTSISIPIPIPSPSAKSITPTVAPTVIPTNTVKSDSCSKTGFAQKWEYLTAYIIKQNDTLQGIATLQLNDSTRVNEILQINGVGPLIADSTLYLPPSTVSKSSGNLKKVYGKLVEKNSASWRINFSNDTNGQGILIPSFWFQGITNIDSYKIGDCIEVFLDDGYKVFSVSLQ